MSARIDDSALHILVRKELNDRHINFTLEYPKPQKRNVERKANKSGVVFGRPLEELQMQLICLHDKHNSFVWVPKVIVSACNFIENFISTEGLYRKSGSAARQSYIRQELDFNEFLRIEDITPPPSIFDITSILKHL